MARLDEQALQALARDALCGFGVPERDAADCARILAMGDLFGLHTHGVMRVESYGERLRLGGIKARPQVRIERLGPAMARVDGDEGLGPVVGMRALEVAMEMAREAGIGIAFAHRTNHFGPIAPYNTIAAEAGFASIVGSNATPTIAPTGGKEARVGNNPIGFGVPRPGGAPIVLDMALSVAARAKIRDALKKGEPIPETWATDAEGRPTADPKAALDGFLLPIGGYKGYGLALMVDLFAGVLSGAAYLTHVESWMDAPERPQGLGHFFILIDVRRAGPEDWLRARMEDFVSILHGTPATDPASPVRLPGERERAKLEQHRRDGVEIDDALVETLRRFAAGAG